MPGPAGTRQGGLCDSRVRALAQGVTAEDEGIDQRHAHGMASGAHKGQATVARLGQSSGMQPTDTI